MLKRVFSPIKSNAVLTLVTALAALTIAGRFGCSPQTLLSALACGIEVGIGLIAVRTAL